MSDRGLPFLNEIISALLEEFQMYHQKNKSYHPQANKTMEAFNKILENALTKICNANWNDSDVRIRVVLCPYRTTYKMLTRQTLFRLVYGQEVMISMEYIVSSLQIATVTDMVDRDIMEEHLA